MNFIQTENLNLRVPSKENLPQWTEWINSQFLRQTVRSTLTPKTLDMQWKWIENKLLDDKRIILEICDKENLFLGIVSLSEIDYFTRSAQISTISPIKKNKVNQYCVYEARIALINYAFHELSLNKIWAETLYPKNKSYMLKNMCIGFEVEGLKHDYYFYNNKPQMGLSYFINPSIFKKKRIFTSNLDRLISKKNINSNLKKLNNIIDFLQVR